MSNSSDAYYQGMIDWHKGNWQCPYPHELELQLAWQNGYNEARARSLPIKNKDAFELEGAL